MLFWSSAPRVRNTLQKLSRFLSFCHAEISYSFLDLSATLKKEKEFHRFKIVRYVCSYPSRQKLLTPHKLVCSISQATYHCSQGLPGALQIVYQGTQNRWQKIITDLYTFSLSLISYTRWRNPLQRVKKCKNLTTKIMKNLKGVYYQKVLPLKCFFFLTRTFFGREAFVTRLCVSFIKEVEGAALFFRARSPHALARLSLHSRFSCLDERKREGLRKPFFSSRPFFLLGARVCCVTKTERGYESGNNRKRLRKQSHRFKTLAGFLSLNNLNVIN